MRRTPRLIAAAVLIAFTGILGGCSSFDPSDMLDFLDTKKKLPGERKPVFPEGVPGLEQGVPREMYKGAAQQPDPNAPAVAALPAEPPPEAKSAKGAKAKKTKQPASAATAPAEAPAGEVDGEAQPEAAPPTAAPPPKQKIVRKRTTAPPPDQPVQQAQPTQTTQQQSQGAFPAPMPSGSFSR
ncbi:hypothetical protein [Bradyrhizobium japonicum]|uniref:hypothetical protein n=1 Tax=Bradyrhizobium japonicum TaxID=375 RepID=UPI000456A564|nr:hypothetical protein [Bradyrhizobium japonicum]AHY51127.1 hypothetical protein BJS_03976 [Bradyrhizobium japonicum SEMIA 5079]MBR0728083.1 hypothetical protein [Bradyrhizobium japonicum]MBR0803037.1 hypothetical protein [Bradyrhizobium japonicum]MBR0913152.1 hypothetical protein [Bradyrhizobium japonicum]MCD9104978.1 hypothetical protein [Bradyrhizobium japonicum]